MWLIVRSSQFEANYGSPSSAFIDRLFGTFREALGKSKEYTGDWSEKEVRSKITPRFVFSV